MCFYWLLILRSVSADCSSYLKYSLERKEGIFGTSSWKLKVSSFPFCRMFQLVRTTGAVAPGMVSYFIARLVVNYSSAHTRRPGEDESERGREGDRGSWEVLLLLGESTPDVQMHRNNIWTDTHAHPNTPTHTQTHTHIDTLTHQTIVTVGDIRLFIFWRPSPLLNYLTLTFTTVPRNQPFTIWGHDFCPQLYKPSPIKSEICPQMYPVTKTHSDTYSL